VLLQAPALGYEVVEGAFGLERLAGAEEAFTSSSVREIMPVVALDGRPLGPGAPGPAASSINAAIRRTAGAGIAPGSG
jgi:branched-chain amino acid aminotransferase